MRQRVTLSRRRFLQASLIFPAFCLAPNLAAQDFEGLLDERDAFVARELQTGRSWEVHPQLCSKPESPASTFKIPNTLIGLETGVIADANFTLPWDGEKRWAEAWNRDHDLRSAMQNSVVWYYQEVARRIGLERMQKGVDRFQYGNRQLGRVVDRFWLDGPLAISPRQQIDFLAGVLQGRWGISSRNLDILREAMWVEDSPRGPLYAKTGWAHFPQQKRNVGWYVGWIESPEETLVFAYNCRRGQPVPADFVPDRIARTRACLQRIGWLGKASQP